MSSYRQMRRQARQARRAGMQPMMVIDHGDQFPELVIVVIARAPRLPGLASHLPVTAHDGPPWPGGRPWRASSSSRR